jgi:feruloyl esterase
MTRISTIRIPARGALALLLAIGTAGAASAQNRDPLAELKLADTKIAVSERVAAGAFKAPAGAQMMPGPSPFTGLPAFHRVAGSIAPTRDSDIRFEVWMPEANWNGRFLGADNGGFAGAINYGALAGYLARGYAVASTDTGHTGTFDDARWAVGHPEKVVDFGHRAIHEMTVKAKAIVAAFYEKAPARSYFVGCSNGGRQALMEAQRYPDDYDGILAGAPASYWTHLVLQGAYISKSLLADPAAYIPASKLKAIEAAALGACDANDGLKDGLISDPSRCRVDPSTLLCKGEESDASLTAEQVETHEKIYAGPKDEKGRPLFPGLSPGDEAGSFGWGPWVTGQSRGTSLMTAITSQFFRSMVYEDQTWAPTSLDVDRAVELADKKLAKILNATDPNLSPFQKSGGKLIVYHGWADAAIAPQSAIDYFESVVAKMGKRETDAFLRLYMVPGMAHCFGGPGPNVFLHASACPQCDAKHDMLTALERWVEAGEAPGTIVATKYENDFAPTKAVRTRPLCPYPGVAVYKGSGSVDDAASFECREPKR